MIRPLQNESEYEDAVREIERFFDHEPKRGTPEADRFDLLALAIEDYESRHCCLDLPDAVAAERKPVALKSLQAVTADIPQQPESAADFVRAMRDDERY